MPEVLSEVGIGPILAVRSVGEPLGVHVNVLSLSRRVGSANVRERLGTTQTRTTRTRRGQLPHQLRLTYLRHYTTLMTELTV